jgi:hypothetical protein
MSNTKNCEEAFEKYGVDNQSTEPNTPKYVVRKKPNKSILSIIAGKNLASHVANTINEYTESIQQYEPYTNLVESCKFIPHMKPFEPFGFTTKVSQVLAWVFNIHNRSKPFFPFNRSKSNTNIIVKIKPSNKKGTTNTDFIVDVIPPNLAYSYKNPSKQLPDILFAIIHLDDKSNIPSKKQGIAQYTNFISGGHTVLLILDRVCGNKYYLIDTMYGSLDEHKSPVKNKVFKQIHECFISKGILPPQSSYSYEILMHPFQNYTEAFHKHELKCLTDNLLTTRDRKLAKDLSSTFSNTFVGHCGVLAFLFADIALHLYNQDSDIFKDCKRSPIVVLFMMLYDTEKGGLSKLYMFLIAKRFVTRSRYMRVKADSKTNNMQKNPSNSNSNSSECEPCRFVIDKKDNK